MARSPLRKKHITILMAAVESSFNPTKPKVTLNEKNETLLIRLVNFRLLAMDMESKVFLPTEKGLALAIRYRSGGTILSLDRKLESAGVNHEA